MDGLMVFLSVVMIIFAVLQIILFFKLWKMTNSIEIIKNEVFSLNRSLIQLNDDETRLKLLKNELFFTVEEYSIKNRYKLERYAVRICNYLKLDLNKIIDKYDAKELYTLDDLKSDLEKKYLK